MEFEKFQMSSNPEETKKMVEEQVKAHMDLFEKLWTRAREIFKMDCLACQVLCVFAEQHAIKRLKEGLMEGMAMVESIAPVVHAITNNAKGKDNNVQAEIDKLEELFNMKDSTKGKNEPKTKNQEGCGPEAQSKKEN